MIPAINETQMKRKIEAKRIITGISPNYVKNWDTVKAIRELIQNYLDSKSEFGCKGYICYKRGMAVIKDFGPGLEPRHLALGISEKSQDAIGKYGEGLKLALLVMAREFRKIEVWSKGMIIRPSIEYSSDYQTEVMVLNIEPMEPCHAKTHQGTTIKFLCSEQELEEAKSYFECFLSERKGFKWIEKGRISLPGGYIYVNGARVGKISDSLFSYHLYEKEIGEDIGNRDREVIDQEKVEARVRRILAETSSLKVMKEIMKALLDGEVSWEVEIGLPSWMVSKKNLKLWKRVFHEVVGKDAVLSSYKIDDNVQANYLGYKVVDIPNSWYGLLNSAGIRTVAEIATEDRRRPGKRIAIKDLTDGERNNLKIAKRLVEKYYMPVGEVIIMEDLTGMVNAARGSKINGAYESRTDKIYLRREILSNLDQTLHTLLHEEVHKYTGADDCTAAFERALTDVTVNIILGLEKL